MQETRSALGLIGWYAMACAGTGFAKNQPSHAPAPATIAAHSEDVAADFLRLFQKDTRQAMDGIPPKWDAAAMSADQSPLFSPAEVASRDYVTKKDAWRAKILCAKQAMRCRQDSSTSLPAPIQDNDRPESVVDDSANMLRSLGQMEAAGLQQGIVATAPWSGDYWATYRGIIAARYADRNFPASADWAANFAYATSHSARDMVATGRMDLIDNLSPAEKLDLLLGDGRGTLSAKMWGEGEKIYREDGRVEPWMGICHGWAIASYTMNRPQKAVVLTAADGRTPITFYPSDIKAYGSLMWANGAFTTRLMGDRCTKKKPATDANGRVTDQDCFDTNPGAWHQAIVNQIGGARRSLVFDATYDYEVWNQPILAYSYRYFNPASYVQAASLAQAAVRLPMAGDKFAAYRSSKAAVLVGIVMDVTYQSEVSASHNVLDSAQRDASRTVQYVYDLELDVNGQIIGGEWYLNRHPDFVWTAAPGETITSAGDKLATEPWNPADPLPVSWQAAGRADAQAGMPLPKLVRTMFALAENGYDNRSVITPPPTTPTTPTPPSPPLMPPPTLARSEGCARLVDGTYVPVAANGVLIADATLVNWYYQSQGYRGWYWGVTGPLCQIFLQGQAKGRICSIGGQYAVYSAANGQRLSGPIATQRECQSLVRQ